MPPATNTIIDNAGNSWSVASGKIYENGVLSAGPSNVILLLWYNGIIYQQNSACGVWMATGAGWTQTPFPEGVVPPAAVGYTCPGIGGIWTTTSPASGATAMMFTSPTALPINKGSCTSLNMFFEDQAPGQDFVASLSINATALSGTAYSDPCVSQAENGLSGTFEPASSMTLLGSGPNFSFNETFNWQFDDLYNRLSSLSTVAGRWVSNDLSTWNIDATGAITESNLPAPYTGCTVTGQISILNQFYNLYAISFIWTGCPAPYVGDTQTMTGYMAVNDPAAPTGPMHLIGGGAVFGNNIGGQPEMSFDAINAP